MLLNVNTSLIRCAITISVVVVLGACGDSPSSAPVAAPATKAEPPKLATEVAPTKATCLIVPYGTGTRILSGGKKGAGQLTVVVAAAWKSSDYQNVYFVAMRFNAVGVSNQTGVWASVGFQDGATIMAVDAIAQQFTDWPEADKTDAKISKSDPGISAAKKCIG
jgi:hypothetical protein